LEKDKGNPILDTRVGSGADPSLMAVNHIDNLVVNRWIFTDGLENYTCTDESNPKFLSPNVFWPQQLMMA